MIIEISHWYLLIGLMLVAAAGFVGGYWCGRLHEYMIANDRALRGESE